MIKFGAVSIFEAETEININANNREILLRCIKKISFVGIIVMFSKYSTLWEKILVIWEIKMQELRRIYTV